LALIIAAYDNELSAVEIGANIINSTVLASDLGNVSEWVDNVRGAVQKGFSPPPRPAATPQKNPSPSRTNAYKAYDWCTKNITELKGTSPSEVYVWINENGMPENSGMESYKLPPNTESFARYIRDFKDDAGGKNINTPRAGREIGKSIVRAKEVEPHASGRKVKLTLEQRRDRYLDKLDSLAGEITAALQTQKMQLWTKAVLIHNKLERDPEEIKTIVESNDPERLTSLVSVSVKPLKLAISGQPINIFACPLILVK